MEFPVSWKARQLCPRASASQTKRVVDIYEASATKIQAWWRGVETRRVIISGVRCSFGRECTAVDKEVARALRSHHDLVPPKAEYEYPSRNLCLPREKAPRIDLAELERQRILQRRKQEALQKRHLNALRLAEQEREAELKAEQQRASQPTCAHGVPLHDGLAPETVTAPSCAQCAVDLELQGARVALLQRMQELMAAEKL